MAWLQIQGLRKAYGLHRVLDGVDLVVGDKDKIGLIGRNGAGKSTLLRIVMGLEEADGGEVVRAPGLRLGYLQQQEDFVRGETVVGYLARVSDQPEWRCAQIASLFGLKGACLQTEVLALSGGYQMRVKLSGMLTSEPELVLLDEPTNYLDLQTQLLLETWLQEYRGAFVVASHDREFLKRVCTSTVEIERGQATSFPQGIEVYLAWKEEQVQMKERFNQHVSAQQKHLQTFIDRFRAQASKATQAQSKLKQLARLATMAVERPLKTVRLQIPQVEHRDSFAFRTCHLAIGYGEKVVASLIEVEIQRGERVVLVGENGQGKSTFLKTAAGVIAPLAGTCTWNNRLKVGYYAQQVHEALHARETMGAYFERHLGALVTRQDVLRMLGNFLFTQDDLTKTMAMLSGGEKARVCLIALLLARPDVLLLDEPTNHLDMETVEALATSLSRWRGTIVFVSHSRTFVQLLATALFDVRDGTILRDLRTYEEYVGDMRRNSSGNRESRTTALSGVAPQAVIGHDVSKTEKRERYERGRALMRQLQKVEKQLEEYSAKKQAWLKMFTERPTETTPEQAREFYTVETVLAHAEAEWLRVREEMERE